MTRRRFIQDSETGELYEVGEDYSPPSPDVHYVQGDIEPYQSMADGSMITSRSHHRAHLRRHGLIEVGNEVKALEEINSRRGRDEDKKIKNLVREIAAEKLRYK